MEVAFFVDTYFGGRVRYDAELNLVFIEDVIAEVTCQTEREIKLWLEYHDICVEHRCVLNDGHVLCEVATMVKILLQLPSKYSIKFASKYYRLNKMQPPTQILGPEYTLLGSTQNEYALCDTEDVTSSDADDEGDDDEGDDEEKGDDDEGDDEEESDDEEEEEGDEEEEEGDEEEEEGDEEEEGEGDEEEDDDDESAHIKAVRRLKRYMFESEIIEAQNKRRKLQHRSLQHLNSLLGSTALTPAQHEVVKRKLAECAQNVLSL